MVAESAVGSSAAAHTRHALPEAEAGAANLSSMESLAAEQCGDAAKAQEQGQSSHAAASPREQRERLKACLLQRAWSADRQGATGAPWPKPSVCELTTTDSGLRGGGLAERLFRHMGSTLAAAALLRRLVCPITKVCTVGFKSMPVQNPIKGLPCVCPLKKH